MPDTLTPLLLSAPDVARLLAVSVATTWRLESAGKLPAPLRIGGSTRWRHAEIVAWVEAGMPDRRNWQAMAANGRGRSA